MLGVGRATRLLRYVTALPKCYVGNLVLGAETTTLDDDGEIVATHDMKGVELDDVRVAAQAFVGEIDQVPPMVSSVKVAGKRLHEIARQGETVVRKPRRVHIYDIEVNPSEDPSTFELRVECGSGTYIRSLAADIASALGGGGHLSGLRRTSIGRLTLDDAHPPDQPVLLDPCEALSDYPAVYLSDAPASEVRFGRPLDASFASEGTGPWRMVDAHGVLLAMYGPGKTPAEIRPEVVLVAAG